LRCEHRLQGLQCRVELGCPQRAQALHESPAIERADPIEDDQAALALEAYGDPEGGRVRTGSHWRHDHRPEVFLMSDEAVKLLREHGYRARKTFDGVREWQSAGLPLATR